MSGFPVWQYLWIFLIMFAWLGAEKQKVWENWMWGLVALTITVAISTAWYYYNWKIVKKCSARIVEIDKKIVEELSKL